MKYNLLASIAVTSLCISVAISSPINYIYADFDLFPQPSEGIPGLRSYGRERALLEQESKVSQFDTSYSYAQKYVSDFKHLRPLVDTISEEEKYGNDGGFIRKASVGLVGKVGDLSRVANSILDAPGNKFNQFSRSATAKLNDIGAYLVGL